MSVKDSNLDFYRPRCALYNSSISRTCMLSLAMFESSCDLQSVHIQSMKAYNRDQLLTLGQLVSTDYLSMNERKVIDRAFERRSYVYKQRGYRAGRKVQRSIRVLSRDININNRRNEEQQQTTGVDHTSRVSLQISRHTRKMDRQLKICALNIRSVNNKVDDVLEVMRTYNLHILALSESWHENSESVTIKRLRSLNFNVL